MPRRKSTTAKKNVKEKVQLTQQMEELTVHIDVKDEEMLQDINVKSVKEAAKMQRITKGSKNEKNNKVLQVTIDHNEQIPVTVKEEIKPITPDIHSCRPPNKFVHITNLVRPFTPKQLRELLVLNGAPSEGEFWINDIKSHCYVNMNDIKAATSLLNSLHNIQWPETSNKRLVLDYADDHQMFKDTNGLYGIEKIEEVHNKPNDNIIKLIEMTSERKSVDELFRKTIFKPSLYWKPLSSDEIKERDDSDKPNHLLKNNDQLKLLLPHLITSSQKNKNPRTFDNKGWKYDKDRSPDRSYKRYDGQNTHYDRKSPERMRIRNT